MPGARLPISELSVKPTEELTEVILPRRAAADDLAVNHRGSGAMGVKPGRICRTGPWGKEESPRGRMQMGSKSCPSHP